MEGKIFLLLLFLCFFSVFVNAEDLKAYKEINFLDSPKAVKEKIRNDKEIKSFLLGDPQVKINGHWYWLKFKYYKNQLYQIQFKSNSQPASYFNTYIKKYHDTLADIIEEKHGKPTFTKDLDILDMNAGFIAWSKEWESESGIMYQIGIGESRKCDFYASMWITYKPLLDEKEAAEKEESVNLDDF